MRVLSRLAGWMLVAALTIGCAEPPPQLPAIGRPAGVSEGPRAAMIVAVRGEVQVEPSQGRGFPARPELQLLRDDRLTVRPGSFVVVVLHNGYLVRLNEGDRLRIDELASFNDEPLGADLEQRFALLLSPSEREDADLRGAITRVAGWNTRMTAADTIPTQSAPQTAAPPAQMPAELQDSQSLGDLANAPGSAEDKPTGAGSQRAPEPPSSRAPPTDPFGAADAPQSDRVEAKKAQPRPGDGVGGSPPVTEPSSDMQGSPNDGKASTSKPAEESRPENGPKPRPDGKQTSGGLDLPAIVVHHRDLDGKRTNVSLPGPLKLLRHELARCAGEGAIIRGQIKARKLVALQVGGVVSECVPALLGKAVALEDGWIEMTVLP